MDRILAMDGSFLVLMETRITIQYVPIKEVKRTLELIRQIEKWEVWKAKSALVGYVVDAESNLPSFIKLCQPPEE
jgi:hypothetical protein